MSDDGSMRYTYRLRISAPARRALLREWGRCRWVWNECVARSLRARRDGEKVGPAALDKMLTQARTVIPWLREGGSVPQQQIIRDFGRSRAKGLKDIQARLPQHQRAGMPKLKKKDKSVPSLNYTTRGFSLDNGTLRLAGGIAVRPVWSRDLPAAPSSVRIYRDTLGHWYASFVVPAQTEPLPETGQALGVDWGVTETATTTNDKHDLEHYEYGRKAQATLTRYQRMMARRERPKGKKQSRGYRKAQQAAAKQHRKVARQRQDTARKWAKTVARDHDQIAVEDFRPKFLAKTTMARKSADAAISSTKQELVTMGRKHARDVRLVDPKYTTMDCAQCGARTTLMVRMGVISDDLWAVLETVIPADAGCRGRPWNDHRLTLEGICWRFRTGSPWRDLPEAFGAWQSIWERHRRWSAEDSCSGPDTPPMLIRSRWPPTWSPWSSPPSLLPTTTGRLTPILVAWSKLA